MESKEVFFRGSNGKTDKVSPLSLGSLINILQEPLAALACAQLKAADVVSYNATMDSCVLVEFLMIVSGKNDVFWG